MSRAGWEPGAGRASARLSSRHDVPEWDLVKLDAASSFVVCE